jgi:NRAMP (natural resistance-associated macrophage protein)-like metal ion transporter
MALTTGLNESLLMKSFRFGPGILVAAAFIGPGTVSTASRVGAEFGLVLWWGLLFSLLATVILQDMALRVGLASRLSLGEVLSRSIRQFWLKWPVLLLAVSAVVVGNAAYQSGNLLGAATGLKLLFGAEQGLAVLVMCLVAGVLLANGGYKLIERALILLVAVMALVFMVTALAIPWPTALLQRQLSYFVLPEGSQWLLVALIGTTVVPYNLFLHASTVQEKWSSKIPVQVAIGQARIDLWLSVFLGGLVTLSIMLTSFIAFYGSDEALDLARLAEQLEPLLGQWAQLFFALGLFAAGLTSAITAPLAAAYAANGAFGWNEGLKGPRFRLTWGLVLIAGTLVALSGVKPLAVIVFAQYANGLLLPLLAVLLIWLANQRNLLGVSVNNRVFNSCAAGVVIICLILGYSKFL